MDEKEIVEENADLKQQNLDADQDDSLSDDPNSDLDDELSCGGLLAAERVKQELTANEVAAQLNLSVTQIKAIELDQSESLPEPTYVRGYIRSYAKLLKLDPEEVLKHYPNWSQWANLDDLPRSIDDDVVASKPLRLPTKTLAFLAMCLLGVLLYSLWHSGTLDNLLAEFAIKPVQTNVETNVKTFASTIASTTTVPSAIVEPEETSVSLDAPPITTPVTTPATTTTPSATTPELPNGNQLKLTFNDTSWVDVRDAEGNRLTFKSYVKGETVEVAAIGQLNVFIDGIAGVKAFYNGEAYDLSQHRQGSYASFVLGQADE